MRALAYEVNAVAAGFVAAAAAEAGARLVHFSTDFVFAGQRPRPLVPGDAARPISAYGRSKRAGEKVVAQAGGRRAVVVRTTWLYSSTGHNFVTRMLKLMRGRDEVRVGTDQIGTPTWARSLAEAVWKLAGHAPAARLYHWSDAGVATWYDFAVAIGEEALQRGLLDQAVQVRPVQTAASPAPAMRPPFSALDATRLATELGAEQRHWRQNLRMMLDELSRA